MTIRWRDAAYVTGVAAGVACGFLAVSISACAHASSDTPASEPTAIVGRIQTDLANMVTGADRYLRSGKRGELAPYTGGSVALPKDMAALALWGDEAGTDVKPSVTALLEAAQDESQIVQSMVSSAQAGGLTYGPRLARGLDEQLPRVRVRFERAKLALEGGSI